jgi:hypothetical protein
MFNLQESIFWYLNSKKNIILTLFRYRKAARQGHHDAMYNIGFLYNCFIYIDNPVIDQATQDSLDWKKE